MDLLIQAKLDMYLHCLKQTWFQKVFPSAVQCAVPTRASGTQQQQARLVLAWERGGGQRGAAGARSVVVVERVQQSTDQANNLLQLIHISRNVYWALPHSSPSEGPKPLMFGLVPPCPRAPGTAIRYGWLVPLPHTPMAGHLYPQPVVPPRDPQAPAQAPTSPWSFVCLALSLLHSCPCFCPMACCLIFCLPQGGATFPALLIYCGGFMATLFQITPCSNGDFGRKERASKALPLPLSQSLGPGDPGSHRMNFAT